MTIFTFDGVTSSASGGGGGLNVVQSAGTSVLIPSGTTADVTISCPAGFKLMLTAFGNTDGFVNDVTITIGEKTIVSDVTIDDFLNRTIESTSRFRVGNVGASGGSGQAPYLLGDTNEDIVFSFGSSTSQNLIYAYMVVS